MTDGFQQLLNRANKLEISKPIDTKMIKNLERELNVIFSQDFYLLNNQFGYDYLNTFEFYNPRNNDEASLIKATKAFRENFNLPHVYLVLYEDDAGLILMKTSNTLEGEAEVIWCSIYDLDNIINGKTLQYNPAIFPTFTDFFEYLVIQEEKERGINRI